MESTLVQHLVRDVLIVLSAGLLAGAICKRLGVSMLVGYLVAGALIGEGSLGLVSHERHAMEYVARFGALLLLFSIGIEFSLYELARLSRYFFVGGTVQMLLVAVPVALACRLAGLGWNASFLIAAATAFSSTVLVFRALAEFGQSTSRPGRRAVGILLFQDAALVPLMMMIPLLTGAPEDVNVETVVRLAGGTVLFIAGVLVCRAIVARCVVPILADLRSTELVVLFAVSVLAGGGLAAYALGLPPAIGAFAAGLVLADTRLTGQIDALILPFRETFAAVFFVSLGTLLEPAVFAGEPIYLLLVLAGVLCVKSLAAAAALRLVGLNWKAALGMGLGLAQLGEFSFVLFVEGYNHGLIDTADYNRAMFVALGTLLATPQLLQFGFRWCEPAAESDKAGPIAVSGREGGPPGAVVIGVGRIGRHACSQLELRGVDVCLVDLNPVNLHSFAQQGFRTIAGDASERDVLERAGAVQAAVCMVSVPDDVIAVEVARAVRRLNRSCLLLVRCRYQGNALSLRRAGADIVLSEEEQVLKAITPIIERFETEAPTRVEGRELKVEG